MQSNNKEPLIRIVKRNILDYFAERFIIGNNLAVFHPPADQVAKNAAEIFVSGVRQEGARVGQHSDKTRKRA